MKIVSSEISTSSEIVNEILDKRDEKKLIELCTKQIYYGADRLDLNCATRIDTEVEDMEWMVKTIHSKIEVPLMPDTPNPHAIEAALKNNMHGRMLVDSITCENSRIDTIMPLVKKYNAQVVVLLHGDRKISDTLEDRLICMDTVEKIARDYNMNKKDMFLDCIMAPLSVDSSNGLMYINCLKALKEKYPEYGYTCGLDNISYGLPEEELINITMTIVLLALGQDYIFTNVTKQSRAFIKALKAIFGEDEYTLDYIKAYRNDELGIFLK